MQGAIGFATFFGANALIGSWFLDSGTAAVSMLGALFAVAALVGATVRSGHPLTRGLGVAAGACAAMTLVLFRVGPGTIFPIVLAFGGALITVTSVAGAVVGGLVRR